jgi:hypothetical protein
MDHLINREIHQKNPKQDHDYMMALFVVFIVLTIPAFGCPQLPDALSIFVVISLSIMAS